MSFLAVVYSDVDVPERLGLPDTNRMTLHVVGLTVKLSLSSGIFQMTQP